ncbi:ribonuclease H-like domain-containing protein [Tanacetum coccineum]|uniref:Ribonuclease H-like domain-containing protein n=1 Tax=Tanacetum coccineum TaxID=301880 RepID=A0ABQ4YPJ4_9ASTR
MTRFDAICGVETKGTNIDELLLKLLGRLGLSSTSDAPNGNTSNASQALVSNTNPTSFYTSTQSAVPSGQATILPHAFVVGTLHDPVSAAWNIDTVRQFVRDNNCTVEFDAFGFFVKDFMTRRVLLRCDSTGDLYPVTHLSPIPHAFLVSRHTWHQRLGYPRGEVLCRLVSSNFISCNKEKPPVFCHAFQLGKHTVYMHQPPEFQDYVHHDYGTDTAYLLLYVDDIVLTASSESLLQQIIKSLHQEFAMTNLGPLNYFLGISVTHDSSGLFLSQKKYAIEILDRAHMDNCNPSRTSIDNESKLGSDGNPVSDPTLYWSLAGSLQYLTFTRPDISYAVQQVCLYMHDPREPYFSALKRILRYVRGTLDYGLQLFFSSTTDLVAYLDADWPGCPTTRRSTSGYCVFLGNNLLSWSSKSQPTLSRSSAEAKYRGVANVVAETCWLRNLLYELHTPLSSATLVYCDNISAVYLSCNQVQHQRTKHIEIDIHFVRDLVVAGQIRVLHVPSCYQFADIFTKGLPSALFEEFRSSLRCPPAPTAREC